MQLEYGPGEYPGQCELQYKVRQVSHDTQGTENPPRAEFVVDEKLELAMVH